MWKYENVGNVKIKDPISPYFISHIYTFATLSHSVL